MKKKIMIPLLAVAMVGGFSSVGIGGFHPGLHSGCSHYVDNDGDGYCDYITGNRAPTRRGYRGDKETNLRCNLFDGIPFSYTGEVIQAGSTGGGMVIEAEGAEVTIFGLGPLWFWECKEVPRPKVGDVVDVSGYSFDDNGLQRNIAASITVDGKTMDLRDLETAAPLWRGKARWLCQ